MKREPEEKLTPEQKKLLDHVASYYSRLPKYRVKKVGKLSLSKEKIKAGITIPLTTWREAIFSGLKPFHISLSHDIYRYILKEEEVGIWMTTDFQELAQMDPIINSPKIQGKVLIGGLGLGAIATFLNEKTEVEQVTVIEKNKDLIKLIQPNLNPTIKIIHQDLYKFLETLKPDQYDSAYFDIWQGTGETEWWRLVVPIYRLVRDKIPKILCWQEETMKGQVAQALFVTVDMPSKIFEKRLGTKHYWVFRKMMEKFKPESRLGFPNSLETLKLRVRVEEENQQDPFLREAVAFYLNYVGEKSWEAIFGKFWDETLTWETYKE